MGDDQDFDGNSTRFEAIVSKQFTFLEAEYGMRRRAVRVRDRTSPPDAAAVVRYEGTRAIVDICWAFFSHAISVLVRIPGEKGRVSGSDPSQYVYFEPFVEFLTKGEVKPVMPYPKGYSVRHMPDVINHRKMLLRDKFEVVLADIAARVRTYGKPALTGDNSRFLEFHKWLGWDVR